MVLTRAALEKLNKKESISLFVENDDKLNSNTANLTNQLAEVNKTLETIESQLKISKTTNNTLEKRITSLEKQCWRKEQNSWRECSEIVGIPNSTNETKVRGLIGKVTGKNVDQDCLEWCHSLPSDKKKTKSKLNSQNEKMLKVS